MLTPMLWAAPILLWSLTLQSADCATPAECREQARAARAAEDYERFHDLAWRAVQKGKPNDPELMLLLARAQSLSGRPHDALVMLRRLTGLGVRTDASTSDDFRRVRALPAWPDLERSIAEVPETPAEPPPTAPSPPVPAAPPPPATAPDLMPSRAAPSAAPAPATAKSAARGRESLRFEAAAFTPSGLAYDRVSRRFIVGDRSGQKLSVVDEFSHTITTLASARGAGFGDVTGLAVDARDGTLWVVSDGDAGSRLHKLQLISARALGGFDAPADGARFVDVAMHAQGAVLVLDAEGRQVLHLLPGGAALQVAGRLGNRAPLGIAPAAAGTVYVTHRDGLARLNTATGDTIEVTAPDAVALTGLVRLRWHDGALVGIQHDAAGRHRAVRLHLSRNGRAVTAIDILDEEIDTADPNAISVVGDTLYYLAQDNGFTVIREVALR